MYRQNQAEKTPESEEEYQDVDKLKRELARRSREIEKLLDQKRVLIDQKKELERILEEVLGSTSWKLTAPLRRTMELSRRARPLVRRGVYSFTARAGEGVMETDGGFKIVGRSPIIKLTSNNNALPTGWVTLHLPLKSTRGHMNFLLYYRTGKGFTGGDRVWLSIPDDSHEPVLIKLPEGVKELRLDPFEQDGQFSLGPITIKELGKAQVLGSIFEKQLKGGLRNPRLTVRKIEKGMRLLRAGGVAGLRAKVLQEDTTKDYQDWVRRYDTLSEDDKKKISARIEGLGYRPVISVVMPVFNPPAHYLELAIESVRSQLYPHWELCIADDKSTDPAVDEVLRRYESVDKRIKIQRRGTNGHISEASNSALELATGEYVALLDHDDELAPHALYMIVEELNKDRFLELLYSDEDKKTSLGVRVNPHFKSDWNRELFLSQNYLCHLTVYKTEVVRRVGGFRKGFEGAQDWDLALRVIDAIDERKIRHIPHVLYHWRIIEGSTAQSTSYKPYVMEAQKRAVEDHLERRGERASVEIDEAISQLRVRFALPKGAPRVTLVIPTKDQGGLLQRCVSSILEKTTYKNFDIVIVDNGSCESKTFELFEEFEKTGRVKILHDEREFNFSRLNNDAVKTIDAPYIAFLNNDLEVITEEWLSEMMSHAVRSGVGAVGARLLYPNGLVQHAGIILGIGGVAGHNHKGRPRHDVGYFNRLILPQNLSAVTAACLVMKRELFEEVGGFDEDTLSVAFNDVDLCLKVRRAGLRIVYTPYAELYHYESASRGYETTPEKFVRFEGEIATMQDRWSELLKNDPYYNPNLTLLHEDFSFAYPPRAPKPWR